MKWRYSTVLFHFANLGISHFFYVTEASFPKWPQQSFQADIFLWPYEFTVWGGFIYILSGGFQPLELLWEDQPGEGDSEDVLFWLLTFGSVMDRTLGLVRPQQVLCHWAIPSGPVVCVLMLSHETSVFWFSAEVLISSCYQFPVCEWPSLGIVPTSKLGCMLTLWEAIIIPFSPSPVCRFEI